MGLSVSRFDESRADAGVVGIYLRIVGVFPRPMPRRKRGTGRRGGAGTREARWDHLEREHTAPSASFSFPWAKFNLERVQLHLFAPADWYEETKPRKITRKMYVLRVLPGDLRNRRERIRNFTNSDSRI